jgi:hypothetical protein
MRTLYEALEQRVLLTDGGIARQLREHDGDVKRDYFGAAGQIELLNLTQAVLVRRHHQAYLRAGADVIRTNALAASPLSLAEHGLGDFAFYVNYAAAEIACQAVDSVPGRGRRRFVLGVVRDQGWDVAPRDIEQAVSVQVEGLLAGGVDGIALDVMPGTGRTPIFLRGARKAKQALGAGAPVFLQRLQDGGEFSARARSLCDGVIRYRHGHGKRDNRLAAAIEKGEANLIGGGGCPEDTVRLDRQLRQLAEDNLRPVTARYRSPEIDEVVPPSSTLDLDPALAEVH